MPRLNDVTGVSDTRADNLEDEGYTSVEDLAGADEDELTEVTGVGDATAPDLIDSAQELLQESHGVETEDDTEPETGTDDGDDVGIEDLEEINSEEPDGYDEPREEEDVTAEDDDPEPRDVDTSPELFDVELALGSDEQYDYLILALVELKVQRVSATHEQAQMADGLLDEFRPLGGAGTVNVSMDSSELNTLHSAVKQVTTRYQGNNAVDAYDALTNIENQIQAARSEYLF